MAHECRRVCGVTFLPFRDGHLPAAAWQCRLTRRRMASRLSGPPRGPGNTGPAGSSGISRSQAVITFAVAVVSGVLRSLRPLPVQVR